MEANFLTDRGQVRTRNEDSGGIYYNESGQLLAIIADGMGGHQSGDVASQMAVSIIQNEWQESTACTSPEQTEEWFIQVLTKMNISIYNHAREKEEYTGMGTTIVAVISGVDFITIAHIGDSRCYIYNESGFNQITEDHSLVNELVRSGQITEEDARHHPRKNIVLKALGTEAHVKADIMSLGWDPGDKLLLCSDGLTDKVANAELSEYIKSDACLTETSQMLVDLANERGGEDNISLVMINNKSPDQDGEKL